MRRRRGAGLAQLAFGPQGWAAAGAVLAVAVAFHFGLLDQLTPGLNRDAATKGLIALKWLRSGAFPFWIPHASAPEPLMVWVEALTIGLGGPSVLALTGVSAAAIVLAAVATWGLCRETGRPTQAETALWAAWFAGIGLAVNVAMSELGRSGLRATLLPAFEGFTFWFLLVALRTNRRRYFLIAGLLLGATAYTYLAARLLPVALGAFLACLWWLRPDLRNRLSGVGLMIGAAALVVLPQLIFFARFPSTFLERAEAVSFMSNPLYAQTGAWGVLGRKLVAWLAMFGVEWSGQYNQSARPLLQPLAFAGWLVAWVAVRKRLREPAILLLVLALPILLLPDLLAGDRLTPHEMRVIGVVVPAQALSGIGLAAVLAWVRARTAHWRWLAAVVSLTLIGWGFVDLYWVVAPRWAASNYAWYERNEVAEAEFILATSDPVLLPLAEYSRPTLLYLLSRRVARLQGGLDTDGRTMLPTTGPVHVVWPEAAERGRAEGVSYYFDPRAFVLIYQDQAYLMPPAGATLPGALEDYAASALRTPTGELAAQVYTVPMALFSFPERPTPDWISGQTFAGRLQLQGASADELVLPSDDYLGITSYWQAARTGADNYRYFVHILNDQQQLVVSEDVMPAFGAYETNAWQPGRIIPLRQLVRVPPGLPPGRYWVELGWYDPLTGRRPAAEWATPQADADRTILGPLKVPAPPARPLPEETQASAQFSDQLALRGYHVEVTPQQIKLQLRLQALVRPRSDFTVFVHVVGADGELAAQTDSMPLANSYPTSIWDAGETVLTEMSVPMPADSPAGPYQLLVGLYLWQTGERLPVTAAERVIDDRLLLTTVDWNP